MLFYGTDAGLVTERAIRLARRLAEARRPAGEILRLDDADLEKNPARISVELQTVPMFGGRKVVRAHRRPARQRDCAEAAGGGRHLDGSLIVEAGNLRPDEALRALFEKSAGAARSPAFPTRRAISSGMVGEILEAAKLQIAPEATAAAAARLGADRALSRGEVEKLALFARGKGT